MPFLGFIMAATFRLRTDPRGSRSNRWNHSAHSNHFEDPVAEIANRLCLLRGHLVIWDDDLAAVLGLSLAQLIERVGGSAPLPGEFCFQPELEEIAAAGRDDVRGRFFRQVFSEHGAFLVARIVNTPASLAQSIQLVRAFVRRRDALVGGLSRSV